jgi:uncharacterized protein (TIGR03083 family)
MSGQVEALRADHLALVDILGAQPPEIWVAPSGCPGWTIKDLVAHLGALFGRLLDPSAGPDTAGLATERAQDVDVAVRREWTADDVLRDYVDVTERALPKLERLTRRDDRVVSLGDLGTYPVPLLVNAYVFDHYTHIRADLLAPRGPIGASPPPSDELRMGPTVGWIMAALPQQCAPAVARLAGPVELVLSGPAGGHFLLRPTGEIVTGHDARADSVASICCSTPALVWWTTRRASWRELGVRTAGDRAALTILRDEIHVF